MEKLILEQIALTDLSTDLQAVLGAAAGDGTLLRFKNAVLARVEKNKNNDYLSAEFLQGVAETLPLMPIDIEHGMRTLCGMFTAATLLGTQAGDPLSTDGIIYMNRFPEVAAGIQANPPTHFLSIEASAPSSQCSVCGEIFSDGKTYCAHLSAKQISGAVRTMLGKGKAIGGAVTKIPAGSRTHFDPAQVGVLASVQGTVATDTNAALELAAQQAYAAITAGLGDLVPSATVTIGNPETATVVKAELQTVQAALQVSNTTLAVTVKELETARNELAASQKTVSERDATLLALQGKIDELEEKLRKAKPQIGLTAIALGTTQDSPTTPIRVVAKK